MKQHKAFQAPRRDAGGFLRSFHRVKASPFGRGVTEGDGEGKDADGDVKAQR